MSHDGRSEVPVGEPPLWLDATTLRLMETERNKAFVWGRDALAAAEMVRQVLLARRPALPMTMIDEAVAAVVPDADGRSYAVAPAADGERAATRAEMAETLCYALRFGLDGKPRKVGTDYLAPLAAAQLVDHLLRSNFRVTRQAPKAGLHGQGW
jgi:hypothetical protein